MRRGFSYAKLGDPQPGYSRGSTLHHEGHGPNYFFNLRPSVLGECANKSGGNFSLVIIGKEGVEDDFYAIPFSGVKHLFTEDTLTEGENAGRWLCNIIQDRLHVYPGGQGKAGLAVAVGHCHGNRSGV
jgi:hypothetical protein